MEIESKPVVVVPSNAYYWNAESVGQAYRQQLDPRYQREEMAEPGSSGQGGADEEPRSITLRNKALYYSQGLRHDAADWIYNICGVAGYLVDTFQIALSIVDRFVDLYESPINRHRFVLVAAAAFLISSKKHETSTPRLTDIAKYLSNIVTADDIKKTEIVILNRIGWNICPSITYQFIHYYLSEMLNIKNSDKERILNWYFGEMDTTDTFLASKSSYTIPASTTVKSSSTSNAIHSSLSSSSAAVGTVNNVQQYLPHPHHHHQQYHDPRNVLNLHHHKSGAIVLAVEKDIHMTHYMASVKAAACLTLAFIYFDLPRSIISELLELDRKWLGPRLVGDQMSVFECAGRMAKYCYADSPQLLNMSLECISWDWTNWIALKDQEKAVATARLTASSPSSFSSSCNPPISSNIMCTGSAFQTPQPSCRTSSRQIYYPQQHDSHTNQQQAPIMAPPSSHSLMETSSTVSSNAPPTESKACTAVRYGLPTPVEELVSVSDTTSAYCAKSTAAFTCGNECTSPCPTKITNHQPCDGDVDYSGGDGDSFTDLTTLYSTTSGEHCASAGGFEHGGDRNNEMDECYNCNCDEEQEEERGKEAEEDDCYFISDGEDSESMDLILDGDHHVKRKGGYPAFVQFTNQINYSHHSHNTNNVQQHVIEQPVAVRHL